MKIEYNSIGIVHTPFKDINNIPNQPSMAEGTKGVVEVYLTFQKGLKDLDGFSHIILLCHFHRISEYNLDVVPLRETKSRGLFATRSPKRPNPIGFSVVRVNAIHEKRLMISDLDILDGPPVIDIKPYFPEFESDVYIKTGWLEKRKSQNH